jgi:Icc-related predicted phosphoesterase
MEQIEVAKGISELGMLVMASAFFLVLSATTIGIVVKLFSKMINNMMSENKNTQAKLVEAISEQSAQFVDIAEGLREETLARIKVLSAALFDLCKPEIARIIKTIRRENHIEDKKAVVKKIKKLMSNIHENRNSKFDNFVFRGKRLSAYTNPSWIDQLSQVVEAEIYSGTENNGRADTNISSAIDNMKLEFYHNLIKGVEV